jgi:hypothetical protein
VTNLRADVTENMFTNQPRVVSGLTCPGKSYPNMRNARLMADAYKKQYIDPPRSVSTARKRTNALRPLGVGAARSTGFGYLR